MRVIFMGTPEFAVPTLEELHRSSHQVVAVVAGPDKPAGRGRKLTPPPIRITAEKFGYPVLQPEQLSDNAFLDTISDMRADIFVVVAFRILPAKLLAIPGRGAVNLHPSLLPKYRGAAPIQHALLNGETETGLTTILITTQIDSGDILLQETKPILPDDDAGSLHDRFAKEGAQLVTQTLDGLMSGTVTPRPQSDDPALPKAPKIKPEDGQIDWSRASENITCQIRAFSPKPGAYTLLRGKKLKLFRPQSINGSEPAGKVVRADMSGLTVGTGKGLIRFEEVQIEGRRRMIVDEFLRGTTLEPGTVLGEA